MKVKFYVDRYVPQEGGWIRITSALASLDIAENMKQTCAARYNEDIENFSIVVSA